MSSTRRRKKNSESNANFPTPRWAVKRFLEKWELLRRIDLKLWLEPCAGDGTIIDTLNNYYSQDIVWTAIDIRDTTPALQSIGLGSNEIIISDFFECSQLDGRLFDVAIFNPPFHLTIDFIMHCRTIARYIAVFQSLNFLGSSDRNPWLIADIPDVYVIPDRVSHTGDGNTDSVYSAWYVWDSKKHSTPRSLQILPCTSLSERKAEQNRIKRLIDEREIILDSMFDSID